MATDKILITGANGQIGTVLAQALRKHYGVAQIVTSDIHSPKASVGVFEKLDVLNSKKLLEIIRKHNITQIYHLAAILSAKGEGNPTGTWDINTSAWLGLLEVARQEGIQKIFFPSSIAVFGLQAQKEQTPQYSPLLPTTMYGVTKVAGEQLAYYYHKTYGLDIRSIRYPGIIGYQSGAGGGTTDYAVDMFFHADAGRAYSSFIKEDTVMPMIYMEDAIKATLQLMEAPAEQLSVRHSYNLQGLSFSPEQLGKEIKKHIPEFQLSYAPDARQAIAESWIDSMDDSIAKADWGWQSGYDLQSMTETMLKELKGSRLHGRAYDEHRYL